MPRTGPYRHQFGYSTSCTKTAMTIQPNCPICLRPAKFTNEDWLPQWARKRLLALFPPTGQHPPRLKVRICGDCNAGLNEQFETNSNQVVGPMLSGNSVDLSP